MIECFVYEYDVIMFMICMDVIDSVFVFGVSVLVVLGLYLYIVFELVKCIILSDKVFLVSIVEMNLIYDVDNRIVKFVVNLVYYFLK